MLGVMGRPERLRAVVFIKKLQTDLQEERFVLRTPPSVTAKRCPLS